MRRNAFRNTGLILLLITGSGVFAHEAGSGPVLAVSSNHSKRGNGVNRLKNIQVVLTCDKEKISLSESLQIDALIWNNGSDEVYLFRRMEWGDGGGMALDIRNRMGKSVGPWIDFLLPPPEREDPSMFLMLYGARGYGARMEQTGRQLVRHPGKYTIQVEYRCPFYKETPYGESFRDLPILWYEDGGVLSNKVAIEVLPD